MLSRLPRQLPPPSLILSDLGRPRAAQLAHALGVSERTAWRLRASEDWPRPVHLALFFASTWGWSAVESDARHRIATAEALADALRRDLAAAEATCRRLEQLADFGAANAPRVRA